MVQAKLPSAKLPRSAMLLGWVFEIDNHQAPSWFEHAGHFSESLPFEVIRQMVHHQGTQHDIKRLVGEGEPLDHSDLEVDGEMGSLGFGAGTGDLPGTTVNAAHAACCANALVRFHRQRSGAAPHIQHRLSGLKLSQVGGPLPELPQLAT